MCIALWYGLFGNCHPISKQQQICLHHCTLEVDEALCQGVEYLLHGGGSVSKVLSFKLTDIYVIQSAWFLVK